MNINDFALARLVHVVAVVGWIGGVWFVTWVVMPAIARTNAPTDRLAAFHRIEAGFAPQARWWVLLAGLSGFWMIGRMHLWPRFAEAHYWWMHAMVALWALFALMLFVLEPLVLHRRMVASQTPEADFARMRTMHKVASLFALATVAGAVGGSHGLF